MRLTARQDLDLPIAAVYARLADFDGWQRAALRRGAEVARTDAPSCTGPGMSWAVAFAYRGKCRAVEVRLDEMTPPVRLGFLGSGPSLQGTLGIDLIEMSAQRTRVAVTLEVKPRTLVARLFLQSLRFGRAGAERKFRARVAQVLAGVERPGQAPRRGSAG